MWSRDTSLQRLCLRASWIDTKKVIAGLELLAGVVAFFLLGKLRNMCRTFLPVDNEAARASLISMNSSVSSHRMLLRCLSQFLAKHSACIHLDCQSTIQFESSRRTFSHEGGTVNPKRFYDDGNPMESCRGIDVRARVKAKDGKDQRTCMHTQGKVPCGFFECELNCTVPFPLEEHHLGLPRGQKGRSSAVLGLAEMCKCNNKIWNDRMQW